MAKEIKKGKKRRKKIIRFIPSYDTTIRVPQRIKKFSRFFVVYAPNLHFPCDSDLKKRKHTP